MKSSKAALINSIILLSIGLWGYAANNFSSHTAIIPLGFGLLLFIYSFFLKSENKILIYIVLLITTVIMLAMFRPLTRNIEQNDWYGIIRVGLEIAACAMACFIYFRNLKFKRF